MNDLSKVEKDLVVSSFRLHKNGLEAIGNPTFEQWVACGNFVKSANGAVHFWIGDWLNYGERQFGETYAQAIDETGYDYGTLANDKWVASRIEKSRRRENLSFAHHYSVADLEDEEQEELLDRAEVEKLNRQQFRKIVRNYKLKLDLPELTDDQRQPISAHEFEKAQEVAVMLLEAVEEVRNLDLSSLHPNAKEFLLSQVRKAIGILGNVANGQ